MTLHPDPTPEEQIAWYAERAAVLHCALRHVAAAWHATHAPGDRASWTRCPDRFCTMAHDAVEGRYEPATYERGRVVSIRRKG